MKRKKNSENCVDRLKKILYIIINKIFNPFLSKTFLLNAMSKQIFFKQSSIITKILLTPSSSRLYHEKVIDHYENPRNVGSLDKNDKDVGTGLVGAPACGDVMKLQVKIDENGKIIDARFKTFGCGSAIASSSLATEMIKGKTIDEALQIKNTNIAKELSLPPVKLHCSMLAEDAIKAAIKNYKVKRQSLEQNGSSSKN